MFLSLFRFTLLATIFLTIVAFFPLSWQVFETPKTVIFQGGTILSTLFLALSIIWGEQPRLYKKTRQQTVAFGILLLFCVIVVASGINAELPFVSLFGTEVRQLGFIKIAHLAVFGLIAYVAVQQKMMTRNILHTIVAAASVASIVAIVQGLGIDPVIWNDTAFQGRVFGTMGHPMVMGQLLTITILISVYLYTKEKKRLITAALILQGAALLLTETRAAAIALAIGLIAFWACKEKSKKALLAIIGIIIAFVLIVFVAPSSRFAITDENLRSVKTRLILWESTIPLMKDRLLLGHGPDSFQFVYPEYKDVQLNTLENMEETADRAHNEFIDLVVHFGIFGLITLLFLIMYIVWQLRKNETYGPLCVGVATAQLTIMLFGFSLTAHIMVLLCIFAIALQQLASQKISSRTLPLKKMEKALVTAIITSIALLLVYKTNVPIAHADYLTKKGVRSQAYSKEAVLAFLEAHEKNPYWSSAIDFAAQIAGQTLAEGNDAGTMTILQGLRTSIAYNVHNATLYLRYGKLGNLFAEKSALVSEQKTLKQESLQALYFARLLTPKKPSVIRALGEELLERQQFEEAQKIFSEYLQITPQYWQHDKKVSAYKKEQKRIFYKLYPDFDRIFILLAHTYIATAQYEKALEQLSFLKDETPETASLREEIRILKGR